MSLRRASVFEKIVRSPSVRSLRGLSLLFTTTANTIYSELKDSFLGVRRTDLWKEDLFFMIIYKEIQGISALSASRLHVLYQFFLNTYDLNGDFAEAGVYKGGTAKFFALLSQQKAPTKLIHLFDTFEGMPVSSKENGDTYEKGDLANYKFEDTKKYLEPYNNLVFHKGLFQDTFLKVPTLRFSFVHVDADIYASIWESCSYFYPRMIQGGIIIFDDYGFVSCQSSKIAIDKFFSDKKETPVYLFTGQCIVIKQ